MSSPCDTSLSTSLRRNLVPDLVAGFLAFLVALPLSLGIAVASGFPPVAGLLTAIVGGLIATFAGSARLSIKGPAAGLIVIALGAVNELGQGDAALGYRRTLAVVVVAAVLQIVFSFVRAGALGDFFPASVVHGMLAAIGVLIFAKQSHVLLGVAPSAKSPLGLLAELPHSLITANPEIALIGALSLVVLFGLPLLPWRFAKRVPAPLVVVLLAMAFGAYFDLGHEHHYQVRAHDYVVGPQFLVSLPKSLLGAVSLPDFSALFTFTSAKYVVMFALVGTIESLLSAKAVDALDPLQRRSDLDGDLRAVGVGNLVAGFLGGLPMITEIVRSSANIANGARSKLANFFHGAFLLAFVAAAPWLLERIPLAALAAMLVYTGLRLASPHEFVKTWKIGTEQLIIFITTLVVTVGEDLLLGVVAGILIKVLLHWRAGMPLSQIFEPRIEVTRGPDAVVVRVEHAAVFSNYLTILKTLRGLSNAELPVIVDLSSARLVDHTVMDKLAELSKEWKRDGRTLELTGLDAHVPVSAHALAARRKPLAGIAP
jgi:MFS superfamily sulfate permease-like transporter